MTRLNIIHLARLEPVLLFSARIECSLGAALAIIDKLRLIIFYTESQLDNLVLSNILFRKTRTVTTMAGVALGVLLVVLTVGIAHGFRTIRDDVIPR